MDISAFFANKTLIILRYVFCKTMNVGNCIILQLWNQHKFLIYFSAKQKMCCFVTVRQKMFYCKDVVWKSTKN